MMRYVAEWFLSEWNRSGNPDWLKALMLAAAAAGILFVIFKALQLLAGKGEFNGKGQRYDSSMDDGHHLRHDHRAGLDRKSEQEMSVIGGTHSMGQQSRQNPTTAEGGN